MRRVLGPISRVTAALACAALVASPVLAAPVRPTGPKTVPISLPLSAAPSDAASWSQADERYEARRHWKRHRHNDGIDGGDLLVGLLVLGGVAAVASSVGKSNDERRARRDDEVYPQRPYDYRDDDDRRAGDDWRGQGGRDRSFASEQDRAVEACSAEAARTGRVDEIFEVDWLDSEWRVRGDYEGGGTFTCSVDADGRAYVATGERDDDDWNARGR